MLVNIIKFIHLLCVIGLLGGVILCITSMRSKAFNNSISLSTVNKTLVWLGILALLTGTLLVHPKNFTFHTPWIQAAYLLLAGFILGILFIKRYSLRQKSKLGRFTTQLLYLILSIVLILIMHDAVTKTTFIKSIL